MHDISNENLSVFSIHTNRLCHDCRYLFKNWVEKGTSDSRVSKVFNIQESCDEDDMSVLEPYSYQSQMNASSYLIPDATLMTVIDFV